MRQLGLTDLDKCHLRLFVYNGDEDDVVTMSDYYADYAKAIETMLEQPDEEDFINDSEISIEDIQNE